MTKKVQAQAPWQLFLRGLWRSPRTVGSVAPSSRWLVQAMLDAAKVEQGKLLVEFGPGTGVFTKAIVQRMRPDARLLVFEVDAEFVALLRSQNVDPRVSVIAESAANVEQHLLPEHPYVDCIVSGLPFTSLPRSVTHTILQATVKVLKPGGVFVTYQYTPLLWPVLQRYFPQLRIRRYVVRNLPPALVFECRKP